MQKCVLKVNIHCDGCKHKVKKILKKIDGVFIIEIDAEQGKVTVLGNVDFNVLIKKLAKSGKHAELWYAPNPNNNNNDQDYLANQLKNMQIDNPKGEEDQHNQGQNPKGGNNKPKGGGGDNDGGGSGDGGQQGPNPQQQLQLQLQQQHKLQQQLQQIQQVKGFQDLNLSQFKVPPHNLNSNPNPNLNTKAVRFDIPEEDGEFTDNESGDDEFDDDEMLELPLSEIKPSLMMNAPKGDNNGGCGNKGKEGVGLVPIQVHGFPDGNSNGGGNNQKQGGSNNGGESEIGTVKGISKNNVMNGRNSSNNNEGMKNGNNPMGGAGAQTVNMGGAPSGPNVGPMLNMSMPNIPSVQGLSATPINSGGNFKGVGPNAMLGNPFQQQQQYMASMNMMNQHAMGNNRFQPMMYTRGPPAVNYMYPHYPYPYPYPHPPPDPYTHLFNDENTSSCNVM
uniref:HMA domain-containing protein n=1 Tax=Cajanus cajan TaxID=3821 RepID=A0A151STS1_CAJCA|nr:hypothetical protein KK1_004511 [Cajanus cajan]